MKKTLIFKLLSTSIFIGIYVSSNAQNTPTAGTIPKEKFSLNKPVEDEIGYTHAIKTGSILYISGTVATGDMPTQIKEIMENIKRTLAKYNATFQNVVKENVYATDLDEFIKYKSIRSEYYSNDFPTATWLEVKRLYLPQYKVEIEVTARLL